VHKEAPGGFSLPPREEMEYTLGQQRDRLALGSAGARARAGGRTGWSEDSMSGGGMDGIGEGKEVAGPVGEGGGERRGGAEGGRGGRWRGRGRVGGGGRKGAWRGRSGRRWRGEGAGRGGSGRERRRRDRAGRGPGGGEARRRGRWEEEGGKTVKGVAGGGGGEVKWGGEGMPCPNHQKRPPPAEADEAGVHKVGEPVTRRSEALHGRRRWAAGARENWRCVSARERQLGGTERVPSERAGSINRSKGF